MNFESLFRENPDGTIIPRQTIRIGGVTINPGVSLSETVTTGGINLAQYKSHDFEVKTDGDVVVILGIY